jgi:hypothetical protein
MQRISNSIAASAEEWGISPRVAWVIAWLPIVGAAIVLMTYLNRPLYRFVTKEDGPIEWAQFFCYALASVAGAGIAFKRFKAGHPWQALLFLGFAFANFFIAGEEIAWGQRIFGLQTPEELKAINHQGEITVHNIQIVQNTFNFVLFLAGLYGSVAYFLNPKLKMERFGDQATYLLVPPLFLVPSFLVLFGYKFIRYTVVRSPGFVVTKYGEWPELCLAFGFFVFAWLNYRRLAAQSVSAPAIQEAKLGDKAI